MPRLSSHPAFRRQRDTRALERQCGSGASFSARRSTSSDAECAVAGEAPSGRRNPARIPTARPRRAVRIVDRVGIELCHALRRPPLTRRGAQIEKAAATDRALRRGIAQHEAIARRGGDRPLSTSWTRAWSPGAIGPSLKQDHSRADFRCRVVQSHRRPLRDRLCARRRGRAAAHRSGRSGRAIRDRAPCRRGG